MPRMQILTAAEQKAFDTPPVFSDADRLTFFHVSVFTKRSLTPAKESIALTNQSKTSYANGWLLVECDTWRLADAVIAAVSIGHCQCSKNRAHFVRRQRN